MDQVQEQQQPDSDSPPRDPERDKVIKEMSIQGYMAAEQAFNNRLQTDIPADTTPAAAKPAAKGSGGLVGTVLGGAAALAATMLAPVTLPVAAIGGVALVGAVLGRTAAATITGTLAGNKPDSSAEVKTSPEQSAAARNVAASEQTREDVWHAFRKSVERVAQGSGYDTNELLADFYGAGTLNRKNSFDLESKYGKFPFNVTDHVGEYMGHLGGCVEMSYKQQQGKGAAQEPAVGAPQMEEPTQAVQPAPSLEATRNRDDSTRPAPITVA